MSGYDLENPATLSELIDEIYRCILERDRWAFVLERLCGLTGGCAASLNVHDRTSGQPDLLVEFGTDPMASQAYVREYGAKNPLIANALQLMSPGEVGTLYQQGELDRFRRSRFYREWVEPQGWGDWMACLLIRSETSIALLAIPRPLAGGAFESAQVRFVELLMPHLMRASLLGRMFDESKRRQTGLEGFAASIKVAAVLLDADGSVSFANSAGEEVLRDSIVCQIVGQPNLGRRLHLADAEASEKLHDALAGRLTSPWMFYCQTGRGARTLTLLPRSEASAGFTIVLFSIPEEEVEAPKELLAQAYGLTDAEVRVLQLLLRGRAVAEIASILGVKPRTVKAHLQKLFEKTGVQRQSDLINRVLRLSPPHRLT